MSENENFISIVIEEIEKNVKKDFNEDSFRQIFRQLVSKHIENELK